MKSILILGAGRLQLPAIDAARHLGVRSVALDGSATAPGLARADVGRVVNITDAAACERVAREEGVSGVLHICSEVSMHVVGHLNETFGWTGPDRASAARATNKGAMRRAFAVGGAPSPESRWVTTNEEGLAAAAALKWPIIVKPARSSGSRGVTRLTQAADTSALLAALDRARGESRDPGAVIERFVEGPEFSVEILVCRGIVHVLAVTDKQTSGHPFFVETGHSQPSLHSAHDVRRIAEAASLGVRALGLDGTAAHAELRLGADGPVLMEIGPRMGGDFISTELVRRSTGIDMTAAAVQVAIGEEPDLRPRHAPRGAAVRYLTPPAGRVTAVRGVEAARAMPGVEILDVDVAEGDPVPEMVSSLCRVGHVIAEGEDAREAIDRAEAARDAIRIDTEPGASGTVN